jgi:hypothetical protein
MSLLSTDITKVKRLSLRETKLPTPEPKVEPSPTPKEVEIPPTDEEIAYSRAVFINPVIETLVDRLDLVSSTTGEKIKKVEQPEEYRKLPEPEVKSKDIDKPKLLALALRILDGERTYTKEDVVVRILNDTKVNQERAEKGFNLLLQIGAIQPVGWGRYYLTGSTPF